MSTTAEQELETQRYPVGRFELTQQVTPEQRKQAIEFLAAFPKLFRQEVERRGEPGSGAALSTGRLDAAASLFIM